MNGNRMWVFGLAALLFAKCNALAQSTSTMSVDSAGVHGDWNSDGYPSVSADGTRVAFMSEANNLVPGGTTYRQIFVHDRRTGETVLASRNDAGDWAGYPFNNNPAISGDGWCVAFESDATNLVPGWNGHVIYVRDILNAHTSAVNHGSNASLSSDGRYVVYHSDASNLVPGDTNGASDVFVTDRQTGVTVRASVDASGVQGDGSSGSASISADGRFVAFGSAATNLVPGDSNGVSDAFVKDLLTGAVTRASLDSTGAEVSGASGPYSISADGRFVAFLSHASDLVPADTNGIADIFVRDLDVGTTQRVDVDSSGGETDQVPAATRFAISGDGRFVTFQSSATGLVPGDTNGSPDVFVHDRTTGATTRASVSSSGEQGNSSSYAPAISADGSCVAFWGYSSNLAPGDIGFTDVFARDLAYEPYKSFCYPGYSGTIACPCGNPPAGTRRGCDNSAATGGASLTGTGVAYLWSDSLVFTTAGEKPSALSVLLQGKTQVPAGIVYGQGLRCVNGPLKRLYTKSASGGSIVAPDFAGGDPTVSARSAARGDSIPIGAKRFYVVYYRDPIVLGGCAAGSTFNTTQTGEVTWWP